MKIQTFMKLVGQTGRSNFFVICPDDLGLNLLLTKVLEPIAVQEDVHFVEAGGLTKDAARELERDARLAPRGSSELTHFFIWGAQRLSVDSVGPLLKAVEEAKYSRFLFQAQVVSRKLHTLMSRSQIVSLPFLAKKVVLGNLRAMNMDAKMVDQAGLYDGTLQGTMRALQMKDTLASINRELKRGPRGMTAALVPDVIGSLAFVSALSPHLTDEERRYLGRQDTPERRKLVLFLAMARM